jgi:aldose 1-epimerase
VITVISRDRNFSIGSIEQGVMKQEIYLYHLTNGQVDVEISNYGCTIVSINVPDRFGVKKNIVAGFHQLYQYTLDHPYLGCTIGRYANRIAYGKFKIDGKEYLLPVNDGSNHLHGGNSGFHKKVWNTEKETDGLTFSCLSKDGEEGYPGNVRVLVHYSLTETNRLVISFRADTDKKTIINLTNHSYFNLTGFENSSIYDHLLTIYADNYTIKDYNNIPTGEMKPVVHTPFDFLQQKSIGKDIDLLSEDMGYDVNYVLNNRTSQTALAAELYEPGSGRLLKVITDRPGLQVYTANWWNGSLIGSQGKRYEKHGAVALETQSFPDSPNHNNFPNTILKPGEVYKAETVFQFLTE